jgi:aconitate hydratase
MSIFDASEKYIAAGIPLVVLAGKEYGSGSSRDWAAKGPKLLACRGRDRRELRAHSPLEPGGDGDRALQFMTGENAEKLGLIGEEIFETQGLPGVLARDFAAGARIQVRATRPDGGRVDFWTVLRIDTPQEVLYYQHGGILPFVLRQLMSPAPT